MTSTCCDQDWTPASADEAAARNGITLGERHWQVISAGREFLAVHGRAPSLDELSSTSGASSTEIKTLFPGAGGEVLAAILGAPVLEKRRTT